MGGPSGVGNTDIASDILVVAILYKIVYLSLCLINVKVAVVVDEGYSSAVVASVFKSSQSLYENWERFFVTYVSNNTTHIISSVLLILLQNYCYFSIHARKSMIFSFLVYDLPFFLCYAFGTSFNFSK